MSGEEINLGSARNPRQEDYMDVLQIYKNCNYGFLTAYLDKRQDDPIKLARFYVAAILIEEELGNPKKFGVSISDTTYNFLKDNYNVESQLNRLKRDHVRFLPAVVEDRVKNIKGVNDRSKYGVKLPRSVSKYL